MENGRLRIGIDLDDVVFEFVSALLKSFEKEYGRSFSFDNVSSFQFPSLFEIEPFDVCKLIKGLDVQNFNFCPDAKEAVFELAKNNDIFFITSRVFREGTLESLEKHFSEIPFELVFSSNPHETIIKTEGKTKGEICNELGIDFMVEDCKKHSKCLYGCNRRLVAFNQLVEKKLFGGKNESSSV